MCQYVPKSEIYVLCIINFWLWSSVFTYMNGLSVDKNEDANKEKNLHSFTTSNRLNPHCHFTYMQFWSLNLHWMISAIVSRRHISSIRHPPDRYTTRYQRHLHKHHLFSSQFPQSTTYSSNANSSSSVSSSSPLSFLLMYSAMALSNSARFSVAMS